MKVKWKRGWKVIRRADRLSCTASHRNHPVKYIKGKEVRPKRKNGPLAVFETREAARRFLNCNAGKVDGLYPYKSWKIVKCHYLTADSWFLWELHDVRYGGKKTKQTVPLRTAFAKVVICSE
jgi:hypothetical protein